MFQSLGPRRVSAAKRTRLEPSNFQMIGSGPFNFSSDAILTSVVTIFVAVFLTRAMIAAELLPMLSRIENNASALQTQITALQTQVTDLRTEIFDKFVQRWW
jgi:hypothetical protein